MLAGGLRNVESPPSYEIEEWCNVHCWSCKFYEVQDDGCDDVRVRWWMFDTSIAHGLLFMIELNGVVLTSCCITCKSQSRTVNGCCELSEVEVLVSRALEVTRRVVDHSRLRHWLPLMRMTGKNVIGRAVLLSRFPQIVWLVYLMIG